MLFGLFWQFLFLRLGNSVETYEQWELNERVISGHKQILSLKPSIDIALEQQKTDQQNKSYDKKQLSNLASRLADQVFQRDYRELIRMKEKDTNNTE